MSIKEFTRTLQSQVYKNWLNQLDKNIITSSAESLRNSQQTAEKTSFYITAETVKDMYKTITGKSMDSVELQLFMQELARPFNEKGSKQALQGNNIKVDGKSAVFFKNIGFDTITKKLNDLLNSYPDVEDAYHKAENDYHDAELAKLRASAEYKALTLNGKKDAEKDIAKRAKERGTLGYYFNKGHVISLATNLTKKFRDDIAKADALAKEQRALLIEVLDQYIAKLQQDDLDTANLPNAVNQEIYASYIKSSDQYLVEMQHRVGNIQAGSASIPIVKELRDLFSVSDKQFANIINKSPSLGQALLNTEGSPSLLDLLVKDVTDAITGKKSPKKVYKQKPTKIAEVKRKITKPKKNTKEIAKAKALRQKVAATKSKPNKIQEVLAPPVTYTLADLLSIIQAKLVDRVKANMGAGDRRDVLNIRTGRLAESAEVIKLSESRAGMITAFYTYMKNPYATFSEGGKQQYPRSRDPKALITKSIREIVEQQVSNRLRAVLV